MVLKLMHTFAQLKDNQMKKILHGFIAIGLLTFVGCDKDDDTDAETTSTSSIQYGEGATNINGHTYK